MAHDQIPFLHSPWPACEVMLMSVDEAAPEFPGALGSGFFVALGDALYLLTARHCMGKLGDDLAKRAGQLLVPAEPLLEGQRVAASAYVQFSSIGRAVVSEQLDDFLGHKEGDLDIVALTVAPTNSAEILDAVRRRSVNLPPTGQWFERALQMFERDGKEPYFRVRGFPYEGTETLFDYDRQHIVMQGLGLVGQHSGVGPFPHTRRFRAVGEAPVKDINGMSGSPVRMRVSGPDQERYALVGMLLGGRTESAHFATVEWLTEAVKNAV